MLKRFGINFTLFLLVSDLVLTEAALYIARYVRLTLEIGRSVGPDGELLVFEPIHFLIVPIVWITIFMLASVYDSRRTLRAVDDLQTVALAVVLATFVLAGIEYFFFRWFSRWLFVYFFFLDLLILFAWRVCLRLIFRIWKGRRWPRETRRVLIVGAGSVGREVAGMVQNYAWTGLELIGYLDDDPAKRENGLPVLGTLDEVRQVVQAHQVNEVLITLPQRAHNRLNKFVVTLHELPVRARVVPDYFALVLYRAAVDDFAGIPMIDLRAPALNEYQRLVKRLFDLVIGGIFTLLALPIMGIVAIAIKRDSPGPVFFPQQRVGENGRLFKMYKFRSMIRGAEKLQEQINELDDKGNVIFKQRDDPRVTRVGRLIRRSSLDELPQLLNVLKGDMSLVGPRPEMPWLVEEYDLWQRKRFAVPQGITGWWQVNGRSDKPMHLHTKDDLYYVKNYSLLLDIRILWRTVGVVLKGRGAY
ncbi:MAG: exopolysaccharide biosynthesis polyprenyl glycosylphosphotransferase [Planctomycetes bacterium]|nr:exopolysaccharide biosynthesis polyprenyl glycosylphosphotransferase [Planctomycetota bacterium]